MFCSKDFSRLPLLLLKKKNRILAPFQQTITFLKNLYILSSNANDVAKGDWNREYTLVGFNHIKRTTFNLGYFEFFRIDFLGFIYRTF